MRKYILAGLFALGCLMVAKPAEAVTCVVAHTFITGETLTAVTMNANPTNETNCINNIDNSNLGSAGIYASQIIPTTAGQATFGGAQTYTFPAGITAGGVIAGTAVTGIGAVIAGLGTSPSVNPGDLAASRSTTTGLLRVGGSSGSGALDYGVTTAGTFTSSVPFNVTGRLNATGAIVAGSGTAATVTAGDLSASRTVSTGSLTLGGSTNSCTVDYNLSFPNYVASACPLHVTANATGGWIQLGGATTAAGIDYGVSNAGAFTLGPPSLTTGTPPPAALFFAANPGGRTAAGLNDYEVGTWTPTDASGASLVFTGVTANYVKIGRLVFVAVQLTYPTTASAAAAQIAALFPAAAINQVMTMSVVGGAAVDIMNVSSGTFNPVLGTTFAAVTNVTLSAKTILFAGTYESTT